MFQINSMLLRKMGWTDNGSSNGNTGWIRQFQAHFSSLLVGPIFDDNELVRFYIKLEKNYIFIKELSNEEKQISKNLYKFVIDKQEIEFNSNVKLIKLIIEYQACNDEYKRHFKLNKLLK